MSGTENEGFCGLVQSFFGCIAIAAKVKNGKIRTQNAKFAGKRLTQDEFNMTQERIISFFQRIDNLKHDEKSSFGKMNAHQIICHSKGRKEMSLCPTPKPQFGSRRTF